MNKSRSIAMHDELTQNQQNSPEAVESESPSTSAIVSKANPRLSWNDHVNCHWVSRVTSAEGSVAGNNGTVSAKLRLANSKKYEKYGLLAEGKATLRIDQGSAAAPDSPRFTTVELTMNLHEDKSRRAGSPTAGGNLGTFFKITDGETLLVDSSHSDTRVFISSRNGKKVESLKTGTISSSVRGKRTHDISVTCDLEKLEN